MINKKVHCTLLKMPGPNSLCHRNLKQRANQAATSAWFMSGVMDDTSTNWVISGLIYLKLQFAMGIKTLM